MVDKALSAMLSEFAATMATDFPIQSILDHLVERIIGILPITAAGVTLIAEGEAPRYVAASDATALHHERLQTELGEGPSLAACTGGEAVAVPDLTVHDARFPLFASTAEAMGLGAVFSFPLRSGRGRFGALSLYRDSPGPLDDQAMHAAQTLADVAAAYLFNAQARQDAKETSDRFRHIALHDPLTGLPNRLLLQQRLDHAARRARRSHACAAVLFVDIDRFKQVNDTHGHQVGDQLLIAVAGRLIRLVRPGDTVARVSGDEFVLLCEDVLDPAAAELLAARIDHAFQAPVCIDGIELAVTASVGVAFAGPGEEISEQLVAEADMAMYQAKHRGGAGHQVIDLRELLRDQDHHTLGEDLRRACDEGSLDVVYQPIVRSCDGLLTGVEALLRWTHPERGPIPPMTIVSLAEQSTLINDVGAWVLERACTDRGRWLHDHPDAPLDLAVNVSAHQVMASDLRATVGDVIARTAMDPAALALELTENVFLHDSARAVAVLNDLKGLGIRLALDDFGTGYSALNYLRRLPIDIVKIDRSFVADIDHEAESVALAAAVTNLAHVLGLTVTVEGVETSSQRDEIIALGCDRSQGFFYARPVSADAIAEHLRAGADHPTHTAHLPVPA